MLKFFWLALFQSAQNFHEKREGSGAGSVSLPLTNGSGSWKPKNMQIQITNLCRYEYFDSQKSRSPLWKARFSLSTPSIGPSYGFPLLKIIISNNIYRMDSVKWGNIVTFLTFNEFFLNNSLRCPHVFNFFRAV